MVVFTLNDSFLHPRFSNHLFVPLKSAHRVCSADQTNCTLHYSPQYFTCFWATSGMPPNINACDWFLIERWADATRFCAQALITHVTQALDLAITLAYCVYLFCVQLFRAFLWFLCVSLLHLWIWSRGSCIMWASWVNWNLSYFVIHGSSGVMIWW